MKKVFGLKCNAALPQRRKKLFYLYLSCMILCSLTIALMPVASLTVKMARFFLVLNGIFFWIGTIGTIVTAILINRARKASPEFVRLSPKLKRLGLTHFFQNRAALISDITMFVLAAGLLIVRALTDNVYILFPMLAGLVFAFGMHCMLNGVNYFYLIQQQNEERN